MLLPPNLDLLHRKEEEVREETLEFLEKNSVLAEHMALIHSGMNITFAMVNEYQGQGENDLLFQMFAVRIFNASGAAIKLGFSGYYQKAFILVRDILEVGFLLSYLHYRPDEIDDWRKDSNGKKFKPAAIRKSLDDRDGFTERKRERDYKVLSTYASHISEQGFALTAVDGLGVVGIFFEQERLKALIEELAQKITHAVVNLLPHFEISDDEKITKLRQLYTLEAQAWMLKYFSTQKA